MKRSWLAGAALLFITGLVPSGSQAGGDPKICNPSWLTGCQARCEKAGGQVRYCPSYCAREQNARGKCT